MRLISRAAIAIVLAAGTPQPVLSRPGPAAPAAALYRDARAPVEARVDDLLARMTLEEKIAQITSVWDAKIDILDARRELDAGKLAQRYPDGIGQFARPSDAQGHVRDVRYPPRGVARTVALINAMQRWATTRTRLGIPILFHEEALHGYAAPEATSFPQAIGMASSWDPQVLRDVNRVVAREVRARGVPLVLSPVVDVARDARWGRIEETFGEDPYLVGEMGVAAVEGLQGPGRSTVLAPDRVFATLKHLTGHGQPESGTNIGPAEISERTLRENFFPPFEQVIHRTGVAAVMPSYNEIDGMPSHANRWLLEDILRREWGFRGAVISDYNGVAELAEVHHLARGPDEAAAVALKAGVDSDLPDGKAFGTLARGVREGRLAIADVDRAVRRMLELKFRAGLFEHPYADLARAETLTNDADARAVALRAAQRSIVLLKNDGALPLALTPAGGRKPVIAVIGPNAAVARLGGYAGVPKAPVSLLDGLRDRVRDRADIVFAQGVVITKSGVWEEDAVELPTPAENRKLIAEAVAAARGADTIVLALGDTAQTSREAWSPTHLGDRTSLDLIGEQQELFDALRALGKPLTVVLINGRPLSTVTIAEQANALVEGWYGGEQGGAALADVLLGNVNPGGKLPVTIARSVGQLPVFYNRKPSARLRPYLFDTTAPLFPFGWGLSYTSFEFSKPRLSAASIGTAGSVDVSVDVRNSGARAGDETVQLYVRDNVSSVTRPIKELRGFRRVTLAPGARTTVTMTLTPESLSFWNAAMERVVEPGDFTIMVGPNSVDLQSATLTVTR